MCSLVSDSHLLYVCKAVRFNLSLEWVTVVLKAASTYNITWSSFTPTRDFLASPILIKSRSADGVESPVIIPLGVIPPGNGVWNPPNFWRENREIMQPSQRRQWECQKRFFTLFVQFLNINKTTTTENVLNKCDILWRTSLFQAFR